MLKKRNPMVDEDAGLSDVVFRLRKMGHAGSVRVDFPVYTTEDAKWAAKLMSDCAMQIVQFTQATDIVPMVRVLRARGALAQLATEVKLRTSHRAAQAIQKEQTP